MNGLPLSSEPSPVEVTNVSPHGLWLLVDDREHFLPFEQFPWFKHQTIAAIVNVTQPHPNHLHWPDIDIDLTLEMIEHPERYPNVAKV